MSRRRILLIACPIAALVIAAGCWYWSWDPVPVASYVPPGSKVVLRVIDLSSGLEESGYAEASARWCPPIAPGLSPLDAVGEECVVFIPETSSDDLVRSAAIATRLNLKAKLAELIGTLVGKSQKVESPAGNRLRMVKAGTRIVYYTRVGRTLIASLSRGSLDAVLEHEPAPQTVGALEGPGLELKAVTQGIVDLVKLADSRGLMPNSKTGDKIRNGVAVVTEMDLRGILGNELVFEGEIGILSIAGQMLLEKPGTRFVPKAMKHIPGKVQLCVGTNQLSVLSLVREIAAGSRVMDRFVRIASEYVAGTESFEGSFTLANASLGGRPAAFLVIRTTKVIFPHGVETGLMAKLGESVGQASYGGQLNEGPFYRVAGAGLADDGFVWFSGSAIVLASSEGALDAIASRMVNASLEDIFSREGDVFLYAHPASEVIGPVRVRFLLEKDKLTLTGGVRLRPAERG